MSSGYMLKYVITAILFVTPFLAWFVSWRRKQKLISIYSANIPEGWQRILQSNIPVYAGLPENLKKRLHGLISVFLAEKRFIGCAGLTVTDEMRVTIAAQACLLYLNRIGYGYKGLKTILIYPSTYHAGSVEYKEGVATQKISMRAGESWVKGPIVLSWDDVKKGAVNFDDGTNVVLHEFAHKLDEENPGMDGLPMLNHSSHYLAWAQVLSREFTRHQSRVSRGKKTVVDAYGATSPAEYFAVLTEHFFEQPERLKRTRPELFEQLLLFYRIDPTNWSTI